VGSGVLRFYVTVPPGDEAAGLGVADVNALDLGIGQQLGDGVFDTAGSDGHAADEP
jgi:hypothetical protein